ncbi:MAG: hypothetical protein ACE5GQ_03210, partial [Nitrospinales bacterium]
TKTLRDTGLTETVFGAERKIWEVDVSMLFYDGQIDSDTFLVRVPAAAHKDDTFRVNYTIFSTEREEFAPTTVMLDHGTSVSFPFKGLDSVWVPFSKGEIVTFTMSLPPLRMVRGIYTWGWRVHPPRIQFLQPIFEVPETDNKYGRMARSLVPGPQLEPQGLSFAYRNMKLTLDGIGDAAPEKKMYKVAKAALSGASHRDVYRMLNEDGVSPRGTWDDWADLAKNQRQLPPEAMEMAGLSKGDFGPYRMVSAYVNNEMYGDGPAGPGIPGWNQGDTFTVKVINLDNHTHYFRNVDFGPRLNDDISDCCLAGRHSFEIMNFKPTYGAPKVAEAQWRAGWGFRPHFDVIQQADVFPRASDRSGAGYLPFTAGDGRTLHGFQYSNARIPGNSFPFEPPPFIVGTLSDAEFNFAVQGPLFKLKDLTVGRTTEGYGVAQMCGTSPEPFCPDISDLHPTNAKNFPPFAGFPTPTFVDGKPTFPHTTHTTLRFPPFLRNPNRGAPNAGDIIAPTPLWKPFFWINPMTGDLTDPSSPGGFWADKTYSHGAPIAGPGMLDAHIESPRGSAQVFYQFDDLFHDNAIFSPHPTFSTR